MHQRHSFLVIYSPKQLSHHQKSQGVVTLLKNLHMGSKLIPFTAKLVRIRYNLDQNILDSKL